MDTDATRKISSLALHRDLHDAWKTGCGWQRLAAVNHNVIGKRFMITALVFFGIGGFLGMLIRTQLATPEGAFMDAGQYAQVFTMHGTIMMFLFAIPFFEGLAIYLLPKMLGARDLAFPRLSAYGYWCYLFGGSMLVLALLSGVAPAGGWFMYTPLSSSQYSPGINADIWLLGITFVEISAISAAIEIVVTILRMRAPGMSLVRMPIFAWYMLVVGAMMLVGFPPLILGSILLEAERAFDLPFFDPQRGGDPLLWQHLFWLFGHPEVYIIFLPAAGALSTIIPVLARTTLTGYHLIVASLVAMAFLSFGLWVHHMYTVGIPHVALSFFSAASALVTIPTAIQIFAWLATLAQGRPQLSVPMLHVFGFFFVFIVGGLTGVMLAMVPFDQQAHDTHFVVAHLHYVLVGGFLFPMLAGLYYWVPHMCGRQPVQHLSRAAFWMIFGGFNLTFFMMHLTGLLGMPRRIYSYPEASPWEWWNLLSSFGSFIMAMGFMLAALDIVLIFLFGKPFRRNPWKAGTLEWAMPTPPPFYNFASIPQISRRADDLDIDQLGADLAAGRGYLGFARHGWMETIGVDAVSGQANQIILLPKPTFLPLFTALATGCFFVSLLFKLYFLAIVAIVATVSLFMFWTSNSHAKKDRGQIHAAPDCDLPLHFENRDAPSILAMRLTLVANATLFSSLLFGGLFLWLTGARVSTDVAATNASLVILLVGVIATTSGFVATSQKAWRSGLCLISLVAYLTAGGLQLSELWSETMATSHALVAVKFAVSSYMALHLILGGVFAGFCFWRLSSGYISMTRKNDLHISRLWHGYCLAIVLVASCYPYIFMTLREGA